MWELESDDALLSAASREAAAFLAFYRRYDGPILAFFMRRTGDPELAADLTAEVFAAVLASSARYRPGKAPAHAWLFAIAQHKLASSTPTRSPAAPASRSRSSRAPRSRAPTFRYLYFGSQNLLRAPIDPRCR